MSMADETKADMTESSGIPQMIHKTVLLHESIDGLALKKGAVYVDGTTGSAGHAKLALEQTGGDITIVAIDRDEGALERAGKVLEAAANAEGITKKPTVHFVKNNYRNIDNVLDSLNINTVDAFMLDLGLSSDQFETSGRGFTFRKDEPLLMTFSQKPAGEELTAYEIVNSWDETKIANLIYDYGEEGFSRAIAKKIVEVRKMTPISTTFELVDAIRQATPAFYHHKKIHFATRTFQALRIATNDELESLKDGIERGFNRLSKDGRMAIISFHSLEDRIVKHTFRKYAEEGKGILINKRSIVPTDAEIEENPRSRSAKLRIIQKI